MTRARWMPLALAFGLAAAARAQTEPGDLAKKREGRYVTGLRLAAYSSDIGFGYG